MTDFDPWQESFNPSEHIDASPCKFDYTSLRKFILEHKQEIVTTIMLIDANIVAVAQKALGLTATEFPICIEECIRQPIIAIVNDEAGRLIDVDDYARILARAARGFRSIAVHRIRLEYAQAYHQLHTSRI